MARSDEAALALIGLVVGLVLNKWPYTGPRWTEIFDAIGEVELADWQVWLTGAIGIVLALFGSVIVVGLLLQ